MSKDLPHALISLYFVNKALARLKNAAQKINDSFPEMKQPEVASGRFCV